MLIKRSYFLLLLCSPFVNVHMRFFFFGAEYGKLLESIFPSNRCRLHCPGDKHFLSAVNGYDAGDEGHNFIFRCTHVLENQRSSPTMQVNRLVPELHCWIIKCKTEIIEKTIHTLQFSWARCHYPVLPFACAGVLPGGAKSCCARSQQRKVMSTFQQGLFQQWGLHGVAESPTFRSWVEAGPKLVWSSLVWTWMSLSRAEIEPLLRWDKGNNLTVHSIISKQFRGEKYSL